MSKRNLIIGIDPGTTKAGWAVYDPNTKQVLCTGHDDWQSVRTRIVINRRKLIAVCVEQVIMHTGLPPSKFILNTAVEVGRIQQVCDDINVPYHQLSRIDICEKVSGIRPKRGVKVTKADMQIVVQKQLKLKKVVRPQHANDALSVILAEYPPNGSI